MSSKQPIELLVQLLEVEMFEEMTRKSQNKPARTS